MLRNTSDGESNEGKTICSKCEKLHNEPSENPKNNYHSPAYNKSGTLYVEHDPVPVYDGGFRKGTPIPWMQAEYMRVYQSFNTGTVLVDEARNKYIVHSSPSGKQELMRINS